MGGEKRCVKEGGIEKKGVGNITLKGKRGGCTSCRNVERKKTVRKEYRGNDQGKGGRKKRKKEQV